MAAWTSRTSTRCWRTWTSTGGLAAAPPLTGGTTAAREKLEEFIENRLDRYVANRNQPQTSFVSHMSKYLHFGHISPVYVALRIREANATQDDIDSFLEEIIVRRELSINFVYYTPNYD